VVWFTELVPNESAITTQPLRSFDTQQREFAAHFQQIADAKFRLLHAHAIQEQRALPALTTRKHFCLMLTCSWVRDNAGHSSEASARSLRVARQDPPTFLGGRVRGPPETRDLDSLLDRRK
jgi:hypothetical protein